MEFNVTLKHGGTERTIPVNDPADGDGPASLSKEEAEQLLFLAGTAAPDSTFVIAGTERSYDYVKWFADGNTGEAPSADAGAPDGTPAPPSGLTPRVTIDSAWVPNFGWREQTPLRVFYGNTRGYFIPNAELQLTWDQGLVGAKADLLVGPHALATQPGGLQHLSPFDPVQAYVWLRPTPWFALELGRQVTTAGMEVINAADNPHITRSYGFEKTIDFTTTGLRVVLGEAPFTLKLGMVPGQDLAVDNNSVPSGFANIFIEVPSFTFSATGYLGPEQADNTDDLRWWVDAVINWQIARAFSLGANFDYGSEEIAGENQDWLAASIYPHVHFADWVSWVNRVEYFQDDGSRTGIPDLKVLGVTTGLNLLAAERLHLRFEYRHDEVLAAKGPDYDGGERWDTLGFQAVFDM